MIKFLRKIKQNLLSEGKTAKYLKYAVGEIILVVIGILIAVGINSKYNEAQNEKKIQAILKQVQKELVTDMKDAKRIFGIYIKSDSLARNIFNDKLTFEALQNDLSKVWFANTWVSFSNKKTGYERFVQNLENLPEKYNILLPYFNNLFREYQHTIDDRNEKIKKFSENQYLYFSALIPNAYLYHTGEIPEKEISAVLNNPLLKAKTFDHIYVLGGIALTTNQYRILSIELYKKIDSLLGTQQTIYPNILSTTPQKEILKEILGEYTETDSENPATITITSIANYLEINHSTYGKRKVYWNGDNYYFIDKSFPYGIYKQYKNKKRQHVWEYTNGLIKKVYIKTSDLNL